MSGFFNSLKNFASGAAYAASSASKYEDELEVEDTKMRFSLTPQPGESGFIQWLDAMKMVARLQGGIPPEFRKRLWLTLAERHLEQRGVDWNLAEKVCFNEWSNPDDEELGIQIVKDLHRTGCSLFCGAAGRDNQAVLRRVLLGFARWNKSVGYCQGLNVLAALVLQVMDRAESAAVKVMIYLIEGVLPEGYFADNLRGLSVDMAVFRDLLRARLPKLSKHLEALQSDARDKATVSRYSGSSYEPPLTNVFTMQWFLTLFCHCLPHEAVLRVWDLIFLEGDEVLLRTALAIWEGLSDRIMTVTSADEFYSIMGVLTREMLEFTDTNNLIKNIVSMGPLHGVTGLREKHRYNITPWARKLSDDDDSDTEEDERLAVAAAMFNMAQRLKKDRLPSTLSALQAMAPSSDRERLALDISTLKQQYAKLRERQRQAHIILSAACARQSMVPPPTSQAMNHLLVGKNALVSGKNRPLSLASGTPPKGRPTVLNSPRSQSRKDRQGVTLHWKDTKRKKSVESPDVAEASGTSFQSTQDTSSGMSSPKCSVDSDSDSTSTELCDEPDRLSDVDSEELTSASESYVMATDDEKNRIEGSPSSDNTPVRSFREGKNDSVKADQSDSKPSDEDAQCLSEISIAKITDQIRRLSAEDDNNTMVPRSFGVREKSPEVASLKPSEEEALLKPSSAKASEDVDYDAKSIRKSLALDNFDYLSFDAGPVANEPQEAPQEQVKDVDPIEDTATEIEVPVAQRDPDTFPEYVSRETSYDRSVVADSDLEESYKYDFSSNISDAKVDSLISPVPDAIDAEQKFYPATYVVGHVPISPLTDQLGKTGAHASEARTHPEITLEKSFLDRAQKSFESKKSPKTPESTKSFSSGETMGPDSKPSSVTVSPRTPVRSESRDFLMDKSVCSSISSDSKTLVLRSLDSDGTRDSAKTDTRKTSYEKTSPSSTPLSTDSLRNKSEISPKLAVSSSSDSCSPSKVKSSERSFSSDLQSPVSANSIKYTSNYGKRGQDSPIDLSSATSPFYPIAHPNQKTPSPYSAGRRRCSVDSTETSPEQRSTSSKDSAKFLGYQSKFESLKTTEEESESLAKTDYVRPRFDSKEDLASLSGKSREENVYQGTSDYYQSKDFLDDGGDDPLSEKDVVPSLPQEKLDKHYLNYNYRHRDRSKLERSSSSLERRFADLKSSASTDEFAAIAKKRSSDILEDIKHLEAKALSDGSPDTGLLTKKTSYIWEDLKNLEARRQDTFSNSASNFSKRRLEIPDISVTAEGRKSYIVHPKMSIDENSDSILKTISCSKNNGDGDADDGRESKLGVWTKVKPRKNGNNGRRSSDRALKIIQENSAILQKILACQAKKRLPDLEEISKEITISPINEEISKIFSPILEKMGLNEHEINEELARINFKDFDNMTATSVSEFDAKINDELSKLSLIDDSEQIDHFDVDDILAHEYLDTREALIDRKINEELSKLLSNYEENFASGIANLEKASSQNASEIDGLELSSVSTNVFSYKSPNDSPETRSDLGSTQETSALPYSVSKYRSTDSSPKSDIDIYRELEKLDKISSAQVLPDSSLQMPQKESPQYVANTSPYVPNTSPYIPNTAPYAADTSPYAADTSPYVPNTSPYAANTSPYVPNTSPYAANTSPYVPNTPPYAANTSPYAEAPLRYPRSGSYDASPLKTSYDPYKTFDFKRLSPKTGNSYPYDKPITEPAFDYAEPVPGIATNAYDLHLKSPMLTKESLEFRVRYDDEPGRLGEYLLLQTDDRPVINSNITSSYYGNGNSKPLTPTKYVPKEERCLEDAGASFLEYSSEADLLRRKYNALSPKEYPREKTDYERLAGLPEGAEVNYLPRQYQPHSPGQFDHFPPNHYVTKLSPMDDAKRPVSHPEFPGKIAGKCAEIPESGTSCYRKSSLSLGNIGHANKIVEEAYDVETTPKTQFSPFPVRNAARKPKELALKLGLYSPNTSDVGQLKRS